MLFRSTRTLSYLKATRSERIKELATPQGATKPEVDTLEEKIANFNNSGCTFVEIIVDKHRTGTKGSQYYLFEGKTMNYFPIGLKEYKKKS